MGLCNPNYQLRNKKIITHQMRAMKKIYGCCQNKSKHTNDLFSDYILTYFMASNPIEIQYNLTLLMISLIRRTPFKIGKLCGFVIPRKLTLGNCICNRFGTVPIKSKYYHTPLPSQITPSIVLCQRQNNLQQKIVLLEHITELIQKQPRLMTQQIKSIIIKQLKLWQNSRMGRMERIVTIAWVIKKLDLYKWLSGLYNEIIKRVNEDQWYVTMEESIKGLQTFCTMQQGQLKTQIFDKLQRNVSLTVQQVNMKHYQRIFVSLISAQRYDSKLFDHFEKQVLKSLGMKYDTRTIFSIINCYALSRQGSNLFYETVQQIMYKGHAYNRTYMFTKTETSFQRSGQYLSMLAETYSIVQQYTKIPLDPDFLNYLNKCFLHPQTEYEKISSIAKIIRNLPYIEFDHEQITQITDHIINTKEIKSFQKPDDLYELYSVIEQHYGRIPEQVNAQILSILQKQIKRKTIPINWAIQITDLLYLHTDPSLIDDSGLIDNLGAYIQSKYQYLYPEDQQQIKKTLQSTQKLSTKLATHTFLPSSPHHKRAKQ